MKKYLDIFIFSLLFFLLFSYFSNPADQEVPTGIVFETTKNSYKVPAGISASIVNNTSETLVFNTCNDISIRSAGSLIELPTQACQDIELAVRDTHILDLAPYYDVFINPGEYVFQFSADDKEYIQTVEVKYRGTIGKIFVGLFYAPLYNLLAYLI